MVQSQLNMSNSNVPSTHCTYSKERNHEELSKMIGVCGLPYDFSSCFDFSYYIQEVYNSSFKGLQEI